RQRLFECAQLPEEGGCLQQECVAAVEVESLWNREQLAEQRTSPCAATGRSAEVVRRPQLDDSVEEIAVRKLTIRKHVSRGVTRFVDQHQRPMHLHDVGILEGSDE